MSQKVDIKDMNEILEKTISAIEESKEAVFEIAESARKECSILKKQLSDIKLRIQSVMKEVERQEAAEKSSRKRLLEVSKDFSRYRENDIRRAYERANELQIQLIIKRQEECDLIRQRTELEMRYKHSEDILRKAEDITSKIGVVMEYLGGNLKDFTNTLEDIQQRAVVGRRIIQAQEEERHRVARDIHDGPAQSLANLTIKAEVCEKLIDIDQDRAKHELQDLRNVLRDSIKDIRKIIYNLRPMSLDDLGFIPTVQRYIEGFQEDTKIPVDFIILSRRPMEDPVKNLAIFRIIQEALNNIRKHAKAQSVKIKLEISNQNIQLTISDDGVGFDAEASNGTSEGGGFGLLNIRERVELLDGTLQIKSAPNKGTRIYVNLNNFE
ncbi:sensor histidine kinase [Alkaliphilus crotonatoxidans]